MRKGRVGAGGKQGVCVLTKRVCRQQHPAGKESERHGFMDFCLALDAGPDQRTLICGDLHHSRSIQISPGLAGRMSATLGPFVRWGGFRMGYFREENVSACTGLTL